MTALEKAKDKIKQAQAAIPLPTPTPTPTPKSSESVPSEAAEILYHVYISSKTNQRIAMTSGKLLTIIASKLITCQADEIAFLDECIATGFPGLSKGESVLASDLDPMNALRKKFYAEFVAAQEAERTVATAVLADTSAAKLVPSSTADVAPLSAESTSVAG